MDPLIQVVLRELVGKYGGQLVRNHRAPRRTDEEVELARLRRVDPGLPGWTIDSINDGLFNPTAPLDTSEIRDLRGAAPLDEIAKRRTVVPKPPSGRPARHQRRGALRG